MTKVSYMPTRKRHRDRIVKEKTKLPGLLIFFKRFYKPLTTVVSITVFFLVYNTYLVDRSISNIQFALQQTANAQSLDDIRGLDMLLDSVVSKEIASQQIDSESLIKLDFAANIAKKAEAFAQIKDAQFMLVKTLEKKKKQRNKLLLTLDAVNESIFKTAGGIKDVFGKVRLEELVIVEPDKEMMLKAQELEKKNDIEGAIKIYEDAFKQAPQYEGVYKIRMAFLYQRLENFNKAKFICEGIIKYAPDSMVVNFAKQFLANLKDAVELSQKKKILEEKIRAEVSPERLQQLYYELGAVCDQLGDFKGAETAYKRAVEFNPNTDIGQKARLNLGLNYKMQSKYEDSENIFNQLKEDFPEGKFSPDVSYWIADSLNNQGKYEEALRQFSGFSEENKDKSFAAMGFFRAGYTCLYDLKDPQRAEALFKKLKQHFGKADVVDYAQEGISTDLGVVHRDKGFKLLLKGEFQEAVSNFDMALKLNPNDHRAYSGISSGKGFLKQMEEALREAKKAVELAPNDSFANANLGFVYILKGDFESALNIYQKTAGIDPKYADVQYNLGWLYQEKGQIENAIEAYKNAIKHNPKMAMAHNNLGTCFWNLDRLSEAQNEFILAVRSGKDLGEAHYNLALMHLINNRLKQAEAELEKILELKKEIPDAERILNIVRQKMQEGRK